MKNEIHAPGVSTHAHFMRRLGLLFLFILCECKIQSSPWFGLLFRRQICLNPAPTQTAFRRGSGGGSPQWAFGCEPQQHSCGGAALRFLRSPNCHPPPGYGPDKWVRYTGWPIYLFPVSFAYNFVIFQRILLKI